MSMIVCKTSYMSACVFPLALDMADITVRSWCLCVNTATPFLSVDREAPAWILHAFYMRPSTDFHFQ